MRSQWIAGLLIGCLMLYISFFGASGIGLSLSGTLPIKEEFGALTNWTSTTGTGAQAPSISPPSQLLLQPGPKSGTELGRSAVTGYTSAYSQVTSFTVTMRFIGDNWGSGGVLSLQVYWSSAWIACDVKTDQVKIFTQTASVSLGTGWHVLQLKITTPSVEAIMDGNSLFTTTRVDFSGSATPRLSIDGFGGTSAAVFHVDYIYVESGGGTPPPPGGTGSLVVTCLKDNQPLSGVTVTLVDTQYSATSQADGKATFSSVPTGSYTVWGKASDATERSTSVTINAGSNTASLDFSAGATPPIPPINFTDPLSWVFGMIRSVLNNSTLRSLLMGLGAVITVVSAIMLVLPSRKSAPRPYFPPY